MDEVVVESIRDDSDGELFALVTRFVDELEYLGTILDSAHPDGINVTEVGQLLNGFNEALIKIKNRPLKALIIHDTKELLTSFKLALELIKRGVHGSESNRMDISFSIRKLKYFLKLVLLSLYEPGENSRIQVMGIRDILMSLCDNCTPLGDDYSFRAQYYSTKRVSNVEMLVQTNTLGLVINEQPGVVFALHTILLNMTEHGAGRINIDVQEGESLYQVNVSDNVVVAGMSPLELVEDIQRKIDLEPEENLDTQELATKGGLRLSKTLLRTNGCTLRCSVSEGMSKTFTIYIPKGNLDLRVENS